MAVMFSSYIYDGLLVLEISLRFHRWKNFMRRFQRKDLLRNLGLGPDHTLRSLYRQQIQYIA
jgi:hypothetical protein